VTTNVCARHAGPIRRWLRPRPRRSDGYAFVLRPSQRRI
jgi:hypothetical protein